VLNWIAQAGAKRGLDITIGKKLEQFLRSAGLVNVTVYRIPIPMGQWGGRLGVLLEKDFYGANRALKTQVVAATAISPEEFDRATDAWLRENEAYHTCCDFYIAYGQCW